MIVWLYNVSYVLFLGLFLYLFGVFNFVYTSVWFYLGIVGALILAFILALSLTLFFIRVSSELRKGTPIDSKLNHHIANSLLLLAQKLMRVKVVVTGREHIPDDPFVMVANHQENYDIIILKPIFKHLPFNFIAKKSIFKAPIIGQWVGILGNVPITKEADRGAAEAIVKGIKLYKKGLPVAIFPEGKRSFSNEMLPFKAGAFKLAMKPKADLLIVTQYNVINAMKGWPFKRQKVYVHIHPILPYEEYQDLNSQELADKVKNIIQKQLDFFEQSKG